MVQLFKRFISFVTHNQLLISLCAACYFLAGCRFFDIPRQQTLMQAGMIFWSALLIYLINTRYLINFLNIKAFHTTLRQIGVKPLVPYGFILLIIFTHALFLPWRENLYLFHLGVISTLYNPPQKALRNAIPLRGVPFLKIFLIGYVWASIGTVFPAMITEIKIPKIHVLLHFSASFSYILAITLPFDIRDVHQDPSDQIITFPHLAGVRFTKFIALIFLLVFYSIIQSFLLTNIWMILFTLGVSLLIIFSTSKRSEWYFSGLLDGSIIIYYFIVIYSL